MAISPQDTGTGGGGVRFDASEVLVKLNLLTRDEIKRKAGAAACRNAARLFANEAKRNVPTYSGSGNRGYYKYGRTAGTLKKSIYVKSAEIDRRTGQPSAHFGALDPTGHLVEYGHMTRGKGGGRGTRKTKAKPFMRPAIDSKQAAAFQSMANTIDRAITKALA